MEKRMKEALDHIKIPEERKEEMFEQLLVKEEGYSEQKRNKINRNVKWVGVAAAALLVVVLFQEPVETLARKFLFPVQDSVTGENGIQSVNIGEMGVTQFQKPEDMQTISQDVLEMQRGASGDFITKIETKQLGSWKQYDSFADMEQELELSFLKNTGLVEQQPLSTTLCVYDQNGLSMAVVDVKFVFGKDKTKICMEIVMEMGDSSKEYRYNMNIQSDYQGIYHRGDGLFEAVLLQNNQSMGPDWKWWADSYDGSMVFDHYFQNFAPLNTYGAVFYYDGIRYNVYGADSPEMLKEILDDFRKNFI